MADPKITLGVGDKVSPQLALRDYNSIQIQCSFAAGFVICKCNMLEDIADQSSRLGNHKMISFGFHNVAAQYAIFRGSNTNPQIQRTVVVRPFGNWMKPINI